jgi:sugar phosphate isomerase/epimerase
MLQRMEFGISTQLFRDQRVSVDVLEILRKAGYRRIELFCNRHRFDFHDRNLVRAVASWFQENGLPAPSIHLPFVERTGPSEHRWISALDPEKRFRETAIDEFKRCLELAERIPPDYVVLHLGNPGQDFNPVAFDYAHAAIAQIQAFAGSRVMIENIPNDISTLERIKEFQTVSQLPNLGICYDTGHGHLQGVTGSLDFINSTHVHDNNGSRDEHLWPFEGAINWPALIEKLVVANYAGPFIFEARGEISKGKEVQSRLRDLWSEAQASIEEFRLKYRGNSS